MKTFTTLFCLIILCFSLEAQSVKKHLISYKLKKTYSKELLKKTWKKNNIPEFISPINYDIDVYEVIYETQWHDGSPIKASGLYFLPKTDGELPLMCYHHGTQIKRSRKIKMGGEQAICIGFATDGYAVARPDYIGLGKGEKFHLYQHADSEAQASIDMMRAIEEINAKEGVSLNQQLFITGYSQGGHAAMALHKTIQEDLSDEFQVTASSPMSGAYDMSGVQAEVMYEPYSHPGYLPYIIFTMQEVYKIVDEEVSSVFRAPYNELIPPMYNGEHDMNHINTFLPEIPKNMIREDYLNAFLKEANFPFKKALEANDVYDWKPETPMQLCYCEADEQVSYKNALVAYKKMKENGSKKVKLRHAAKDFNHNKCAVLSALYTKMWFDSFKKGSKKGNKGPIIKRIMIGMFKKKMK